MNHTALIVVDLQNTLVELKPFDFDLVLSNIKLLIEANRAQNNLTIFIQHTEDGGDEFNEGSHGWDLYDQITPNSNELVMIKKFNSAFKNTQLNEYLHSNKISRLIIVGMQTEYCIDATIKSAFDLGYEIIIPEKTNTTFNNDLLSAIQIYTHHNYYIFNGNFGEILSIERTLEIIKE
ncbi:MAG: cysteine hydrolase [Firmicutes bacterium]|nr:cysteine hydrolase [Bacillota bacterium]